MRNVRWSQIAVALLLGLVLEGWSKTVYLRWLFDIAPSMPLGLVTLGNLIQSELNALSLLIGLLIADRAVDEGAPRRCAYILAALGACALAVLASFPLHWLWDTRVVTGPWPANMPQLHYPASLFFKPLVQTTHFLLIGGAFVFLYADRRAARKTAQLLRDAELDRIRRSRLTLESQLQAMQARVEPQFLLDTLRHVGQLYEVDAGLAARVLDELIAYLRAAMPVMRDTTSTLAQELELIRAYLDIASLRVGGQLSATIDAVPGGERIHMPPMLLLPLVAAAVGGHLQSAATSAIRVTVDVGDGRLQLSVAVSGGLVVRECGEDLASVRERLQGLYGDEATLVVRHDQAGEAKAILDLPLRAGDVATA